LSAVKNVKCIDDMDSILIQLYKFYHYSSKRINQLRKVSAIPEQQIPKFQYLHAVRWVASEGDALIALVTDWKSVTVCPESNVCTQKGNITAVAKGLLKKLKDFKFLYMILFLVVICVF
jgi:hypothetical protein